MLKRAEACKSDETQQCTVDAKARKSDETQRCTVGQRRASLNTQIFKFETRTLYTQNHDDTLYHART